MTVGEYIQAARLERGLTQSELGEKCGISGAEISRIESGKRRAPSPRMLKTIANALIVDYAHLMHLAGYIEEVREEEETFEMHEILRKAKLTPEELAEILEKSPLTRKN